MTSITREKLAQAVELVWHADVDVWLTFVRETAEGGDPVLPLICETGLVWQSALLVSRDRRKIAIVGNYDADPLRHSGDWDEVVPYVQGIREALVSTLERLIPIGRRPTIAVNFSVDDVKADGLSHGMYLLLLQYLADTRFADCLVSAEAIVGPLRSVKSETEIERIRKAIQTGDELFAEIGRFARIGVSEREIYDHVQRRIDSNGFGYGWDRAGNPIVNTGPDSMVGHGVPSADIRISAGHILHIDLGVIVDGYSSDNQRCWYVPGPDDSDVPADVLKAFEAVNAAISAGAEVLRPGVAGWEVDLAARTTIQAHGYPEYLHALGHQVGRAAHDGGAILGPQWDRYGNTPRIPIEVGMVFTLELGVFVEGRGYLGIEEIVVVREHGVEWLSERQLHMPMLGR